MKAIVFDIDGVITKFIETKQKIITRILKKYNIYDIEGVKEILDLHLNRQIMLDRVYLLIPFDKETVLNELNQELAILESNPTPNQHLVNFIKKNSKNYIFCTSTTMPLSSLNTTLDVLSLRNHFHETLTTERGEKKIISCM